MAKFVTFKPVQNEKLNIDNDKLKEIWAGMAKLKHQEGEYYEQLARMVDEMTPEVIYQSVQATP